MNESPARSPHVSPATYGLPRDPIRFELVRNALATIGDEMALTIVRTSRSSVLKDNMDFSTALCDAESRMIAQGLTIALHLGSVPDAMVALLRRYPRETIRPGDVFILNDPFEGGMHLPDVFIIQPIFADLTRADIGSLDGGQACNGRADDTRDESAGAKDARADPALVAFAVTIGHQADVGGRVPGSNASDSTEIFAEGLRIPPLKLYDAGVVNETLLRIVEKNVRLPEVVMGDLHSQLAACAIAEREVLKLVARYGLPTLRQTFDELLDYSERVTRAEIASWPDGVYSFTDHIDDDGIEERPIPLVATITVQGDGVTVDYTGSSRQVKGAINATPSFAKSLAYAAIRSIMDVDVPNNAGYFRPIQVITPPGTIVNPSLPAAFAARGLTGFRLMDTLLGVLAQIKPERVPAACEGGNTGISIGGWDPERGPFIFVEFICGAGGARPGLDGVDAHANPAACMCNVPCEVVEAESPVVIERYGLVPNTGGAGEYRGGLALVRDYRFVGEEAVLQVRSDRRAYLPYGLAGGRPGTPSSNVLNPDGEARELPSKLTMTIKRGDLLHHVMPGAGGLGDPLDRVPARVLDDVLNEKLDAAYARREYGVVLDLTGRAVDAAATERLRADMRGSRAVRSQAG